MPEPLSEAARVVGDRIRDARLHSGLSQEEIANLAGMNVSNYGKIERGLSNPTLHTLLRVAHTLGVDLGKLVTGVTAKQLPDLPEAFTAADFVREQRARRR